MDPPSHGQLQIEREDNRYEPAVTFMMADIYDNKITYTHDGSDTLKDEFQFTVSDGTNPLYKVKADDGEVTMSRPQVSISMVSHSLYFLAGCHVSPFGVIIIFYRSCWCNGKHK